jgi:predicted DNA-binding protein
MTETKKTIQELEAELEKLERRAEKVKKRIAEVLEKSGRLSAAQIRKKINTGIEFIADFDLIKAKAVNISTGGICFETSSNLPFEMRFQYNGKTVSRRAKLIWLKHKKRSGYVFGLKFISKHTTPGLGLTG